MRPYLTTCSQTDRIQHKDHHQFSYNKDLRQVHRASSMKSTSTVSAYDCQIPSSSSQHCGSGVLGIREKATYERPITSTAATKTKGKQQPSRIVPSNKTMPQSLRQGQSFPDAILLGGDQGHGIPIGAILGLHWCLFGDNGKWKLSCVNGRYVACLRCAKT